VPSEDIFRITAGVRACVCTAIFSNNTDERKAFYCYVRLMSGHFPYSATVYLLSAACRLRGVR
jgi:hypothetical protein